MTFALAFMPASNGQSITSGDVTGTITDPSSAAVPNASITLTSLNTNAQQKATTNAEGSYRFAFVSPGTSRRQPAARRIISRA